MEIIGICPQVKNTDSDESRTSYVVLLIDCSNNCVFAKNWPWKSNIYCLLLRGTAYSPRWDWI